MVYLSSGTSKVLLRALHYLSPDTYWVMGQYLLQNTYWVMVYFHSTTIKELRCALFVFSDILGQCLHWQCEQVCAAQYLFPNTYSPTDPNG
jgi:hypothetical protein